MSDAESNSDAESTTETKEEKAVTALQIEDGEESAANAAAMRKVVRSGEEERVSGRCLLLWLVLLTFGVGFGT